MAIKVTRIWHRESLDKMAASIAAILSMIAASNANRIASSAAVTAVANSYRSNSQSNDPNKRTVESVDISDEPGAAPDSASDSMF